MIDYLLVLIGVKHHYFKLDVWEKEINKHHSKKYKNSSFFFKANYIMLSRSKH